MYPITKQSFADDPNRKRRQERSRGAMLGAD